MPTHNQQPLLEEHTISDTWPLGPPHDHLHVYITLPANVGSPPLPGTAGEYFIRFFTRDSYHFCRCHSNISFFPPSTAMDQREPDSSICLQMTN